MATSRQVGFNAEDQALAFLLNQQLILLQRNFSCRHGEIDLIMRDRDHIVFIEVRFRKNQSHGDGATSVESRKMAKLVKTATYYLVSNNLYDKIPCRFDVVSMGMMHNKPDINWIKDAFTA